MNVSSKLHCHAELQDIESGLLDCLPGKKNIGSWIIGMTVKRQDRVTALVMSHVNGLKPFERTIKQPTETVPLTPKQ